MEEIDKIWAGIIAAITGTGVYLSAMADFLIAGPILGVVAGFTLSYVVQTKTQKRAWKREFLLKNIDQIYGPLYNDSLALETQYNSMLTYHSYSQFQSQKWEGIRNSYIFHMIEDEEFRKKLDEFYLQIEMFNENIRDAREHVNKIVNKIGTKYYDVDVEKIIIYANNQNQWPTARVDDCLLFNIHPKETFDQDTSSIIQINHRVNNSIHRIEFQSKEEFEKFEQLWEKLVEDASKNKIFETVRKTALEIHVKNLEIRQKLVKRISERQKL